MVTDTFMTGHSQHDGVQHSIREIARQFVAARQQCRPLEHFPGLLPERLEQAYAIQDAAIGLRQEKIGGWKVGRIPPEVEQALGCDRLAGPIFNGSIHLATAGDCPVMPIFAGGFAAVEAEFVAVLGDTVPPDRQHWTLEAAAATIAELRIGLEIASSPLASINDIGPLAVISDFGNNAGLIVGAPIRDWQSRPLASLTCEAFVDDVSVGRGGALRLSGGFLRSVQFMLELAAGRGHTMVAGTLIATGQTTGIHDVRTGQRARLDFASDGELECRFTTAQA